VQTKLAGDRHDLHVFAYAERQVFSFKERRRGEQRFIRREADDAARMHGRGAAYMLAHADQRADCQMHVLDGQRVRRVGLGRSVRAGRTRGAGRIRGVAALRAEVVEQELALLDAD
jgi:hypothetical protein